VSERVLVLCVAGAGAAGCRCVRADGVCCGGRGLGDSRGQGQGGTVPVSCVTVLSVSVNKLVARSRIEITPS